MRQDEYDGDFVADSGTGTMALAIVSAAILLAIIVLTHAWVTS